MPWCESCERYLSPANVGPGGACPTCGRPVDPGAVRAEAEAKRGEVADGEEHPKTPWHFKLMAGTFAVYLGYRAVQGVAWVAHRLR